MRSTVRSSAAAAVLACAACSALARTSRMSGAPGLPAAGDPAVMFAPGIVSTGDVFSSTFTPDGKTVVFTKFSPPNITLMSSTLAGGVWFFRPRRCRFPGRIAIWIRRSRQMALGSTSPRGARPARRPPTPRMRRIRGTSIASRPDGRLPVRLPEPVNDREMDYYPSTTRLGVLYFDSFRSRPRRRLVYRAAPRAGGRFAEPQSSRRNDQRRFGRVELVRRSR